MGPCHSPGSKGVASSPSRGGAHKWLQGWLGSEAPSRTSSVLAADSNCPQPTRTKGGVAWDTPCSGPRESSAWKQPQQSYLGPALQTSGSLGPYRGAPRPRTGLHSPCLQSQADSRLPKQTGPPISADSLGGHTSSCAKAWAGLCDPPWEHTSELVCAKN